MPEKKQSVVVNFAGGWATDFGPSFVAAPQGNALTIPFLSEAKNVLFELDGAPHKIGGTKILNSVARTSFAGLYDYWKQGTIGAETQAYVGYDDTTIVKIDPTSGVVTQLSSGWEAGKIPCFEVFKDTVLLATNSTIDTPQTWDQVAANTSNLGGSPPKFSFMVKHKNRLFAAGVATNGSRLYYSASLDATTWTGLDAGSIDIDPDDGDRITGLASHKNELIIFKGPNKLSIHRLIGSSPTGTDAFARIPFVVGMGAINHNTIFRVNDDVVFASPRGMHSLAATAAFGNYIEAYLSRPILGFYHDSVNHATAALATPMGINYQLRGVAIWIFPTGSLALDTYFVYDYRFQPGRWSRWTGFLNPNCIAIMQSTPQRQLTPFVGTTTGVIHELDRQDRSINLTTAYTADVKLPFVNFGSSAMAKTIDETFFSFVPKGNYNFTVGQTTDSNQQVTNTVSQSGSDPLG